MRLRPCCYESDLYFEHGPSSIECRGCGMCIGESVDNKGQFLVSAAWNAEWLEEYGLTEMYVKNDATWRRV